MIKRKGLIKSRRGLSEVIGYILLISMTIILSTIVYQWLKSYVPAESPGCSDGVSLLLENYKYDCSAKTLELNLKNNGRFGIAGFFIHATTKPGQELATLDLSGNNSNGDSGYVKYFTGMGDENNVIPEGQKDESFIELDLKSSGISTCTTSDGNTPPQYPCIYSLEIIPLRYEDVNERNIPVSCTNAKITQELKCYVAPACTQATEVVDCTTSPNLKCKTPDNICVQCLSDSDCSGSTPNCNSGNNICESALNSCGDGTIGGSEECDGGYQCITSGADQCKCQTGYEPDGIGGCVGEIVTLFYDGFSDLDPDNPGPWTSVCVSGCGSPPDLDIFSESTNSCNLDPDCESYYMATKDERAATRSITTNGNYKNIEVSYYRRTSSAPGNNRITVQWRVLPSGSWADVTPQENPDNNWVKKGPFTLPSTAESTSQIEIRFWLDNSGNEDYSFWDSIKVMGQLK